MWLINRYANFCVDRTRCFCSAAVRCCKVVRNHEVPHRREKDVNRRRWIKVRPFRDRPRSRQSTARVIKLLSRLSTSARLVLFPPETERRRVRETSYEDVCVFGRRHLRFGYDRSRWSWGRSPFISDWNCEIIMQRECKTEEGRSCINDYLHYALINSSISITSES